MKDTSAGNLPEKHVVSCFLEKGGLILLLRRSNLVGTFRGMWAGVSGYVESPPEEQALTEIREETGLGIDSVHLARKGDVVEIVSAGTRWCIHPFLFHVTSDAGIRTDWEHTEHRWIYPSELGDYDTVPGLGSVLASLLGQTGE